MMTRLLNNKYFPVASFLVIIICFGIEYLSTNGVYTSPGYIIAVLFTLFSPNKIETILVTILCMIAIVLSAFLLHPAEQLQIASINHAVSLFVLVFSMFFILWIKEIKAKSDNNSHQINTLFNHATEGIILTNSKGEIILANPFSEKILGYEKDELIGKNVDALVPSRIQHTHHQHRDKFIRHPDNRPMGIGRDLYAKRKDGSEFPVEISLSHYVMNGQRYVVAFMIDISIRKKNEAILSEQKKELERVSEEIKRLNFSLEQKVLERTMMLRETLNQLEQSKNELSKSLEKEKELGELKSRFVSIASHEFRTPLSAILSSVSLIDRYKTTEEQEKRDKHIARIKENVEHLNEMLKDLLSLGKLEEGVIKAEPDEFDASENIRELCMEMQEIGKPGQRLITDYSGETLVFTDKKLLRNILINLLSNAVKFSPENSEIKVVAIHKNNELKISVSDSGIGISKEDQNQLFERFFRAKNAVNIQGTGLGLHIVQKYLDLLHGKIELQSELEKGTTFTVTIPTKKH